MTNVHDLTVGPIRKSILKLAIPLMGTGFLTMAYTLTDLYWVGLIDTYAVAAVGLGGLFWWLVTSLSLIANVGLAVTVSQNLGRKDYDKAREYINAGVKLNLVIAILYTAVVFFFHNQLLGFFDVPEQQTMDYANVYLKTVSPGFLFLFMNPILTVILNATGNSRATFKVTAMGVGINMLLDPFFIVVLKMGVFGAAIATALSQLLVFLIYIIAGKKYNYLFSQVDYLKKCDMKKVREILELGLPPAMQSAVHCFISMYINKMVAGFGSAPVAAQSIGSQIESISWLTAAGFSTANATFIGQNYGAGEHKRANDGYFVSIRIVILVGIFANLLLYFGRYQIIQLFLHEAEAIEYGAMYLMALSFSQTFMVVEIADEGAFNGISMTKPPAFIGIVGNLLRIPLAFLFIKIFGIIGVWMAISVSSILKGSVSFIWFNLAKTRRLHLANNL